MTRPAPGATPDPARRTGSGPGGSGPGGSGPGGSGPGGISARAARTSAARLRATAAVLAVLATLGLALLASHSGPPFATPSAPSTAETIQPAPARTSQFPGEPGHDRPPSRTLSHFASLYMLIAAAMLFLALAAVPLVLPRRPQPWRWRLLRALRPLPVPLPPPGPKLPRALADAIEVALARLDDGPLGDAIVACWLGLEAAAAKAGTHRLPSQTSAELTERVLADHQVTPQTLRRLAELYREARFSGHTLGADARADARALLERVRDELRVSA
jgi:hypothetical protein